MARTSKYLDHYRRNSTGEMLLVLNQANDDINDLLTTLIKRRDAAKAAGSISLPATAESGEPVVHGARCRMDTLYEAYNQCCVALARLVDDTYEKGLWK